jgi:hypothetical protein
MKKILAGKPLSERMFKSVASKQTYLFGRNNAGIQKVTPVLFPQETRNFLLLQIITAHPTFLFNE